MPRRNINLELRKAGTEEKRRVTARCNKTTRHRQSRKAVLISALCDLASLRETPLRLYL